MYSLNLVDEVFEKEIPEFIHHYQMVHDKHSDKLLEGLHLVFVELPKFKPQAIAERKMAVLWLRFLTEINNTTESVPQELLESKEIRQAVELVEESAYTREQLRGYDKFWDYVRVDKTLASAPERSFNKGKEVGLLEGKEAGLREGKLHTARNLKAMNFTDDQIVVATGLTIDEIASL